VKFEMLFLSSYGISKTCNKFWKRSPNQCNGSQVRHGKLDPHANSLQRSCDLGHVYTKGFGSWLLSWSWYPAFWTRPQRSPWNIGESLLEGTSPKYKGKFPRQILSSLHSRALLEKIPTIPANKYPYLPCGIPCRFLIHWRCFELWSKTTLI
jgi:hypothetical protein